MLSKRCGILFYLLAVGGASRLLAEDNVCGVFLLVVALMVHLWEMFQFERPLTQWETWLVCLRAFLIVFCFQILMRNFDVATPVRTLLVYIVFVLVCAVIDAKHTFS